jgi:hypothetical protein
LAPTRREILGGIAAALTGEAASSASDKDTDEWSQVDSQLEQTQNSRQWRNVNRDLRNSGSTESKVPTENPEIEFKTDFDTVDLHSYAVVDEKGIFVGDDDGTMRFFDRETGDNLWNESIGDGMSRPIAVGESYAYGSAGNGNLAAVDKLTGKVEKVVQLNSVGEVNYIDGTVAVTESTGTVRFSDEDLTNERKNESHWGDIIIPSEVTVADGDHAVYVERDGPDASLRMMDMGDASEVASFSVDGNAEDGAVLVDGKFIYNEDDETVAVEVNDNGFGGEAWRKPHGESKISPVAVGDGKIVDANESGEIYEIDVETGDRTLIDDLGDPVGNIVAGENTIVADAYSDMRAYDISSHDEVQNYEDLRTPIAVVDDQLLVYEGDVNDPNLKVQALTEGEQPLNLGYGLNGNSVGDGVFVGGSELGVNDVSVEGGSVETFDLEVFKDGESVSESFNSSGELEGFDVYDLIVDSFDDWTGDYEVEVSVEAGDGDSTSVSKNFELEDLTDNLIINGNDFTGQEDQTFSVELDNYSLSDVDESSIQWILEDEVLGDGEEVEVNVDELEIGAENSVEAVLQVGPDDYGNSQEYDETRVVEVEAPEITALDFEGNDVKGDNTFIAGDSFNADPEINIDNYVDSFELEVTVDGETVSDETFSDVDAITSQDIYELIQGFVDEPVGDYQLHLTAEYGDDNQTVQDKPFTLSALQAEINGASRFPATVEDEPGNEEVYNLGYQHDNSQAAEEAVTQASWSLSGSEDEAELPEGSETVLGEDALGDAGESYTLEVQTQVGTGESSETYSFNFSIEYTPPVLPGRENPPIDTDGDGRYEDLDGDGDFTIFDVQALFNNLDEKEVQQYADAYNFNGDEEPDGVTIFDVQGLFNKLGSG